MNKKAQQKMSGLTVVLIIAAIVIGFLYFKGTGTTTTPSIITNTDCPTNPTITNATATDALNAGSALTISQYFKKNGVYVGTTTPTVVRGDAVSFIAGSATTVDEIFDPGYNVACGNNPREVKLKTYGNATIQVAPDTLIGTGQYLTNAAAGGAANETKTSAGGSRNNAIRLVGNDKKTTGKILVIVELASPSNVSNVALSGASEVAVPNGYSRQLTNGYVKAFEIPSMDGAQTASYNLQMSANTATVIQGAVYTSWYAEQAFVDTDGSFKVGAFDSINTAKWQDLQTYNWIMK